MSLTPTQREALSRLFKSTQKHRFAHHKTLESLAANGFATQLKSGSWKITAKGRKALAA